MKLARIRGHVLSTVRHGSMAGQRLLIAQPVDGDDKPEGAPQIVIDNLGAAIHQKVLLCSDGSEARKMVGTEASPVRWFVLGLVDPERSPAP